MLWLKGKELSICADGEALSIPLYAFFEGVGNLDAWGRMKTNVRRQADFHIGNVEISFEGSNYSHALSQRLFFICSRASISGQP
jgi:hypothetical protein